MDRAFALHSPAIFEVKLPSKTMTQLRYASSTTLAKQSRLGKSHNGYRPMLRRKFVPAGWLGVEPCDRGVVTVRSRSQAGTAARMVGDLEAVDLDGFSIQAQPLLLIGQELLDILALVALQLYHLAHLRIGDDGAIAGELLLDDFENLLLVELLGQALDRRQRLTTIALCVTSVSKRLERAAGTTERHALVERGNEGRRLTLDTDMDVILTGSLGLAD